MNAARIAIHVAVAFVCACAAWAAAPASAQLKGSAGAAGPTSVQMIRGRYCVGFAPPGYQIAAENPQRVAFGADVARLDGLGGAGFAVFGGGPMVGITALATPQDAVAYWVSRAGSLPVQFGPVLQMEPNVFAVEMISPRARGLAIYRVIPAPGGFMIVMRSAQARSDIWPRLAPELVAVARALRCTVPMVPAEADPPPRARDRSRTEAEGGDPEYNQWLDTEYYHDPRTGQNYWVSPGRDWSDTGPQGPGYYIRSGNDTIKLDPGFSQ